MAGIIETLRDQDIAQIKEINKLLDDAGTVIFDDKASEKDKITSNNNAKEFAEQARQLDANLKLSAQDYATKKQQEINNNLNAKQEELKKLSTEDKDKKAREAIESEIAAIKNNDNALKEYLKSIAKPSENTVTITEEKLPKWNEFDFDRKLNELGFTPVDDKGYRYFHCKDESEIKSFKNKSGDNVLEGSANSKEYAAMLCKLYSGANNMKLHFTGLKSKPGEDLAAKVEEKMKLLTENFEEFAKSDKNFKALKITKITCASGETFTFKNGKAKLESSTQQKKQEPEKSQKTDANKELDDSHHRSNLMGAGRIT